jgi:hypothetical protein
MEGGDQLDDAGLLVISPGIAKMIPLPHLLGFGYMTEIDRPPRDVQDATPRTEILLSAIGGSGGTGPEADPLLYLIILKVHSRLANGTKEGLSGRSGVADETLQLACPLPILARSLRAKKKVVIAGFPKEARRDCLLDWSIRGPSSTWDILLKKKSVDQSNNLFLD